MTDADEQLAQAIRDHADAYGYGDDGALLGDFAVIASWIPADGADYAYTTHYNQPTLPQHVTLGLFSVALEIVRKFTEPDDD